MKGFGYGGLGYKPCSSSAQKKNLTSQCKK